MSAGDHGCGCAEELRQGLGTVGSHLREIAGKLRDKGDDLAAAATEACVGALRPILDRTATCPEHQEPPEVDAEVARLNRALDSIIRQLDGIGATPLSYQGFALNIATVARAGGDGWEELT